MYRSPRLLVIAVLGACAILAGASCILPLNEGCHVSSTIPTNLVATPGNGHVMLNWSVSDTSKILSEVRYAAAGNDGACASEELDASCTVACPFGPATSCLVSGLANGTSYALTVRTVKAIGNPSCSYGYAHASVSATPAAN